MSGLVIENLSKAFDGQTVLTEFNLSVKPGELLVVLGPSGCGKSTLLRLIAGLEAADSGRINLADQDITNLEPQKRRTAMVFQNYALYPHMTVFENMAFPLKVAHTDKAKMRKIVEETAELLELGSLLQRRPAQLSGGQRQRVALGRGLVRKPSIFLLDEPLSNLDAALRLKMRQEIVMLQKRIGVTMLYVTHDQTEALTMADRMVVLNEGHIRQIGTPEEIYNDPADKFTASFIGTPPINLFHENITDGRGEALPLHYGDIRDGEFTVAIRPEYITIDTDGGISGEIISSEYIGAVSYIKVHVGRLALTVVVDNAADKIDKGNEVKLRILESRIYLFDIKSGKRIK